MMTPYLHQLQLTMTTSANYLHILQVSHWGSVQNLYFIHSPCQAPTYDRSQWAPRWSLLLQKITSLHLSKHKFCCSYITFFSVCACTHVKHSSALDQIRRGKSIHDWHFKKYCVWVVITMTSYPNTV